MLYRSTNWSFNTSFWKLTTIEYFFKSKQKKKTNNKKKKKKS